jgi:hypothetical protein
MESGRFVPWKVGGAFTTSTQLPSQLELLTGGIFEKSRKGSKGIEKICFGTVQYEELRLPGVRDSGFLESLQ